MKMVRKWMTLWLVAAIVALNLLAITPTAVYACSCAFSESPAKELRRSTAVFAGKVTDMQWDLMTVRVTFDVSEVWKGSVQKVQTVHTSRDEASCGFDFAVGKEYLVYANGSAANLEVFLCSRTGLLATAVPDLVVLGTGTLPGVVAPVQWLPTTLFTLLGLLLIALGLFPSPLTRRFWPEPSPRMRYLASKTKRLAQIVLILFGAGLFIHAFGNGYLAYGILNLLTLLFWLAAVIGMLIFLGKIAYFWRKGHLSNE